MRGESELLYGYAIAEAVTTGSQHASHGVPVSINTGSSMSLQ
jgi:hypothetical protein